MDAKDGGQMEWSRLCWVEIYEIYDDGLLCNEANYTYINTYIIFIPQLPALSPSGTCFIPLASSVEIPILIMRHCINIVRSHHD